MWSAVSCRPKPLPVDSLRSAHCTGYRGNRPWQVTHTWSPLVCAPISLSSERFGRVSLFLPEGDEKAFSIARGTDACEVRLDVGNHHQLAPWLSGFFRSCLGVTDVAGLTGACKVAVPQAAIPPTRIFPFLQRFAAAAIRALHWFERLSWIWSSVRGKRDTERQLVWGIARLSR